MKSNIPAAELERAEARVDQHLEALRRKTERLGPLDDSSLVYRPNQNESPDQNAHTNEAPGK